MTRFGLSTHGDDRLEAAARYHASQLRRLEAGGPPDPAKKGVQAAYRSMAAWLDRLRSERGERLDRWPHGALRVASRFPAEVLEAAELPNLARDAAEVLAENGAVGRSPTPYPDTAHLRRESRQGRGRETESGRARDGAIRPDGEGTYGALAEHAAAVASRPSSAEFGPAELLRAEADGELGEDKTWRGRELRWLRERALREAVQVATGRTIADRWGSPLRCWETAQLYQHTELADARQLRVHTCSQRERCPHCGRAYGEMKGRELESVMSAALDRADVQANEALGWGVVVTLPREVSDHLGALVEAHRMADVRKEVKALTELARRYLARLLLGKRAEKKKNHKELAAAVNVHWWPSETPTNGWHWHLHLLVPNAARSGGKLRRRAAIDLRWIRAARRELEAGLLERWGELIDGGRLRLFDADGTGRGVANANVRYYVSDAEGWARWRHRCRYDARHPWFDVAKLAGRAPELLFADGELGELRALANRVEDMQRLKCRRWLGWLAPGQRKKYGLRKLEGEDLWVPLEGGWCAIRRFGPTGLWVQRRARTLLELERFGLYVDDLVPATSVDEARAGARWEFDHQDGRRRRPPARGAQPATTSDATAPGGVM